MPIQYLSETHAKTSISGTSFSVTHNYTGVNGAILGVAWLQNGSASSATATYNGTSMTRIVGKNNSGDSGSTVIFGLLNPDAGSHSLAISYSTSGYGMLCAMSFSNVNQTTPWGNVDSATGTSTTPSLFVTVPSTNVYTVDVLSHSSSPNGTMNNVGGNQTSLLNTYCGVDSGTPRRYGAISYKSGIYSAPPGDSPRTQTMSWSDSVSQLYCYCMASINGIDETFFKNTSWF